MKTRLSAILLTDLSGYTSFTAGHSRADLEAAVRQLERLVSPIIARHGGRLVKWIGDAALARFDSATEAVLCGRSIQEALVRSGERSTRSTGLEVKAVVTLGDVCVAKDGDVFGEAVNLAARIEKHAQPGAVYFTDAVRSSFTRAEIPHEQVGTVELKGIPEPTRLHRTTFERSPAIIERAALLFTDFKGVMGLADKHGWEVVHPAIDRAIGQIVRASRERGGTVRSVVGDGCFLTFPSVAAALDVVGNLAGSLTEGASPLPKGSLVLKTALHFGALHVMAHTLMGRDMNLVERLADAAAGGEVLVSDDARKAAIQEGVPAGRFSRLQATVITGRPEAAAWKARYGGVVLWRLAKTRRGPSSSR